MKIFTKKSLAIAAALLLVVIILLVVYLVKNNKYDIEINDPFTSLAKESTTTLTCEFSESSAFYKIQNNGIQHIAGKDKNAKPVALTFVNYNSNKPQLDSNLKLQNGNEMIDDLFTLSKSSTSIVFGDKIPGGEPAFYTLFPIQKVAVWQQTASQGPDAEIASSFDSMGFCH